MSKEKRSWGGRAGVPLAVSAEKQEARTEEESVYKAQTDEATALTRFMQKAQRG